MKEAGKGWILLLAIVIASPLAAQVGEHVCAEGAEVDFAPPPIEGRAFHSVRLLLTGTGPDRTLRLVDPESERSHLFKLPQRIRLKAQRKRDFGGRTTLEFADLAAGQELRLTFRAADRHLVGVRVLKADPPASGSQPAALARRP